MAAPNLLAPTTVTGKTFGAALTATTTTTLIGAVASGHAYRVKTISVSNVHASNAGQVTLDVYNGTTGFKVANAINIPINTTLMVLPTPIYLEETFILRGGANATVTLEINISYEDIS